MLRGIYMKLAASGEKSRACFRGERRVKPCESESAVLGAIHGAFRAFPHTNKPFVARIDREHTWRFTKTLEAIGAIILKPETAVRNRKMPQSWYIAWEIDNDKKNSRLITQWATSNKRSACIGDVSHFFCAAQDHYRYDYSSHSNGVISSPKVDRRIDFSDLSRPSRGIARVHAIIRSSSTADRYAGETKWNAEVTAKKLPLLDSRAMLVKSSLR